LFFKVLINSGLDQIIWIEIFVNFSTRYNSSFKKIKTQPNPSIHKKQTLMLVWIRFIKLLKKN